MGKTNRIWTAALLAVVLTNVYAQEKQIYLCQAKPRGPSTYQDFPCAGAKGGTTGITSATVAPQQASPSNTSPRGFPTFEQYSAARDVCMKLMLKYDVLAPLSRCQLNDVQCFNRANQESEQIMRRLTSLPQWQQQQCDMVVQLERTAANDQSGCSRVQLLKPVPFLGTADEEIHLSDGSVWKDISYKYLYLYAYNPTVLICPAQSKMIFDNGGQKHSFSLVRLR